MPSIIQEAYKALALVFAAGWRNRQRVLNALIVITAIVLGLHLWRSYGQRRLVLFVDPPGSSSANVGQSLVDEIRQTRNSSGVSYNISLEPTAEKVSVRERMAYESSRVPLGMVEDGITGNLGPEEELRALLPMEWEYLFVLCSRDFLTKAVAGRVANAPDPTLADVINCASANSQEPRLYLGPCKIDSFNMARVALNKIDAFTSDNLVKGIADWQEIRLAFKQGRVDLAFYAGPLGAELIDEIASDGKAVLLSLGDITEAIQHETGFQVYAAGLPENLGVVKEQVTEKENAAGDAALSFCRKGLKTLARRRVLACPRSLSTADAYLLAVSARTALEENGYHINLKADDAPFKQEGSNVPYRLRMPTHPALELLEQGQSPTVWRDWSTWPGWLRSIVSVLGGLVLLDALRLLTSRGAAKPAPPTESAGAASESPGEPVEPANREYAELDAMLTSHETKVDEMTHRDIAAELAEWDERLRAMRQAIHRSPHLTDSQRESLWKRYRALSYEVESSVNWVAPWPAGRKKLETPAADKGSEPGGGQPG